ncbi:MAG: ABC transporter ATP-binding protein [Spirochaetes bacterium]|nr:ABC transporter ATP-binding protein [Spirochaetota bacterium]
MLEIVNLKAGYRGVPALQGVTLEVHKGEIVGIIGSNGAGKSTLIRAISGLIKPTEGTITFKGIRIDTLPSHEIVRLGIIQVPEGRHLFGKQTVEENLKLGAYLIKDEKKIKDHLEHVYSIFPILKERKKQRAETLSGGQQQMLAIGRGLMSNPELLIVDECSLGVAPIVVEEIFRILKTINAQGTTIMLVEQKVHEALELAHRAYVLQTGRVVMHGTGEELLKSELVQKAYLGI